MNNSQLQESLKTLGYYKGGVDGKIGPRSKQAINDFLATHAVGYHRWGEARRLLAAKQLSLKLAGLEVGIVDGLMGPQTRYAFEVFDARQRGDTEVETWRDAEKSVDLPNIKPVWPTQAQVEKFYGAPGKNQTMLILPFPMRIAWDKRTTIKRFSIHEKVHDSAARVFNRIADAYDHDARQRTGIDLFGGCLNVRRMRGGTSWSMHSWGIAIDFDPERNQLKWGRDKARLAQPDCATFWRLWEEEGWVSLGRARNYDWMHVQAARL